MLTPETLKPVQGVLVEQSMLTMGLPADETEPVIPLMETSLMDKELASLPLQVVNIVELDVAVLDIRDRTLSTRPGLDTDTVLTVGTATVEDTNSLDSLRLATLTKGANTETVATVTVDVVQGDIGGSFGR
ncbi:hypothetical protein G6F46_014630 [Rhizopus delemar]|uniref:Uncharacterized protein n=1 Tax=Rhizopus oryzae TaxID=64495 RepID=A0A9P6XN06_RHIOR|nr:hypothetical protein G6F55_014028 [Rhizopus delemar]KAG1528475.1 hypothetical protein G6F51_014256 [Rhizopus arrhizus]KAG1479208.1 hypothetical protein G6F54_013925 [Rhizopus delemar]KAG1486737.1 hypothetical protein G6F53_013904 [Rhizopus delemar]KAG1531934.1 hypothetical protein G6F49_013760 [Rhizopus delemar]